MIPGLFWFSNNYASLSYYHLGKYVQHNISSSFLYPTVVQMHIQDDICATGTTTSTTQACKKKRILLQWWFSWDNIKPSAFKNRSTINTIKGVKDYGYSILLAFWLP